MSQELEIDLVNRDPNNINDHVRVQFEDILAEPEGAHSANCVWANSYFCFSCCKSCCYKLMTLFCGIPMAMCWGIGFACIAFNHVWHITPCMRCYTLQCGCLQKFYGTCLQCCAEPCYESAGYMFNNIRITKVAE